MLLTVIYVMLIAPSVNRHPHWYDELHTVYIAQATSVQQLVDEIRLPDLNHPLSYLSSCRTFPMKIFGVTEIGSSVCPPWWVTS